MGVFIGSSRDSFGLSPQIRITPPPPGGVDKLDKLNEQNCTRDSRMTYNAKRIYYELKLDILLFTLIGQ